MKYSKDKKLIHDHVYYYLLAWNEANGWQAIQEMFNCKKLADLSKEQITLLFELAANSDLLILKDGNN